VFQPINQAIGDLDHFVEEGSVDPKKPISEKRLQANRANAKRSTGPKTAAGKALVRRNALKHGLLSRTISLLPNEAETFNSIRLNMTKNQPPETTEDGQTLEEIARIWCKLEKVMGLEIESNVDRPRGATTAPRLIHRYERSLSQQLHARIRQYEKCWQERNRETGV
jgi:hypothetical protein